VLIIEFAAMSVIFTGKIHRLISRNRMSVPLIYAHLLTRARRTPWSKSNWPSAWNSSRGVNHASFELFLLGRLSMVSLVFSPLFSLKIYLEPFKVICCQGVVSFLANRE